jgi:hypothetical protein
MKRLFILFAAVGLISCKDLDIKKVSYSSATMMGRTQTTVTQDSVVITFNGRGEPTYFARPTKSVEWEGILNSLTDVDLKKIADLEAPSNKRSTDAAPFGMFEITTKDSTYQSNGFDGGNPHEMLKPLMKQIEKIREDSEGK